MATSSKSDISDCAENNETWNNFKKKSDIILEETFYILSKKNTVFKVRLANYGLCLIKENNGNTKEQTISIAGKL